jgi:imidazolonepropionase-like amidohydrolase
VRRACAGGVTTLFGIPGSGTSLSGFGVLYKAKTDATFAETVLKDPGGMKVAQTHNPERRAGDLGLTRCGLAWLLEEANGRAMGALAEQRFDLELENLKRVHARDLPVLIHCAAAQGVAATARMWQGHYGARAVLSHGCFNGHKAADFVAGLGMPVNCGPRTMDYLSTRSGEIVGVASRYLDAGVPLLSLNTDSSVMPQEELFLQGAMSARLGADGYQMLRAVTIHPAMAFGIEDRVGSLEPGKDADVVIYDGDPLDPRSRVELVLIDGDIQYDRARDGQWF